MKKNTIILKTKTIAFFISCFLYSNYFYAANKEIHRNSVNQFLNSSEVTNSDDSLYWLNLTSPTGYFNQMAVGYVSYATLGVDRGVDGLNINNGYYLCSIIDGNAYSIQGRPLFTVSDVVPLVFKIATAGDYTIDIDHLTGVFASQDIFIKDKLTNTIHDLKSAPYTFSSEVGTFNSRFEIVYQIPLAIQQSSFKEKSLQVYKQNQELIINSGTDLIANVEVYDVRGKLIISKNNINASDIKLFTGMTREVLIAKITSDKNEIITKKFIN